MEEPYGCELRGILTFADFPSAEETIRRLEKLRQRFSSKGDKKGVGYCRKVARLGRRRAELISRNSKVNPSKRRQKEEIAHWFRVWLETPELFDDWLSLRKNSEEFRRIQKPSAEGHSSTDVRSHAR